MTSRLDALCLDAEDPAGLALFWAGLLDWHPDDDPIADAALHADDETGFRLVFVAAPQPKTTKNQAHLDLTSATAATQQETVTRALDLGARHIDIGQRPEEEHVVLADPEGNEFCVIGAGNAFLADCGFLGAVACDGSRQVGYFWSQALGWPLVWDQDQETAIRSPHGGPKLTWGGPPVPPKLGRSRLRFLLAVPDGEPVDAEITRLTALGARPADGGDPFGGVALTDPDGNDFCLIRAAESPGRPSGG